MVGAGGIDGGKIMTCHICGGQFEKVLTSLPLKVGADSIVILKNLPVLQCRNCPEYLIEDPVSGENGRNLEPRRYGRRAQSPATLLESLGASVPKPPGICRFGPIA